RIALGRASGSPATGVAVAPLGLPYDRLGTVSGMPCWGTAWPLTMTLIRSLNARSAPSSSACWGRRSRAPDALNAHPKAVLPPLCHARLLADSAPAGTVFGASDLWTRRASLAPLT